MKYITVSALLIFLVLFVYFMSGDSVGTFQECSDAVSAKYPADKPKPLNQPYNDISDCMAEKGYKLVREPFHCDQLDYEVAVMNGVCYRPSNPIKGYAYDLKWVFR